MCGERGAIAKAGGEETDQRAGHVRQEMHLSGGDFLDVSVGYRKPSRLAQELGMVP